MTTKADFAPDEWKLLLAVPPAVGTAVMHAGRSGLGTVKESFALVNGIMRADKRDQGNQLIKALIDARTKHQEKSEIETLHSPYAGKKPAVILEDAVRRCRAVVKLLVKNNVPPDEARGYREWAMRIATHVAEASKEGSFLGFGGERVSEAEVQALAAIREALELDPQDGSA